MSMKKLMFAAFALLFAMGAMAQDQPKKHNGQGKGIETRAKKSADWINEQVKLTPEQYTKVYHVQLESMKKLREIKKDTSLTQEQARAKAREVKKNGVEQIKSILTSEQYNTLVTTLKERKEMKKNERKAGKKSGAGGGIEKEIEDELLN